MNVQKVVQLLIVTPSRVLGRLESVLLLGIRWWVSWDFIKSGWLKITSWDTTLALFRTEYHVPLLPSDLAAVVGTAGEIGFPVLLFLGLASRLAAIGLSAVNVLAVVSYADVLLSEGFEAALGQHYMWGFALLVLVVFGPGKASVDYLLLVPRRAGVQAAAAAV